MKIFNREPAVWVGLAGWLISLLGAFVLPLTTDQEGALNLVAAAVVGLVVAVTTRDGWVAAALGLLKAIMVGLLAWHFDISPSNQALIYGALAAVLAAYTRTQVIAPVPPDAKAPVEARA